MALSPDFPYPLPQLTSYSENYNILRRHASFRLFVPLCGRLGKERLFYKLLLPLEATQKNYEQSAADGKKITTIEKRRRYLRVTISVKFSKLQACAIQKPNIFLF